MRALLEEAVFILLSLLSAASLTFFLIHLAPGDPADFILKEGADLQEKQLLRKELGLDQPLVNQYGLFMKNLFLQADLGRSLHRQEPVSSLLKRFFPMTLNLAFLSLFFAALWGVSLGVFSVIGSRGKKTGKVFDSLPAFLVSLPAFVTAPLLIWLFALHLHWLPISGAGSPAHLILPSLSLALPLGAVLMKMTRTSMLQNLSAGYVRTAAAKGLSPAKIYFRHILFNALIPVITLAGLQLGALLTGAVIVEIIFDRPGLGSLLLEAVTARDYPLIQGSVLLMAFIYIFVNRLTDKVQAFIHPQMR